MTDDFNESIARIRAIGENIRKMLEPEEIDDFIYTEQEEKAWLETEHDFTKRIATPILTKQQRRVTLRQVT